MCNDLPRYLQINIDVVVFDKFCRQIKNDSCTMLSSKAMHN